MKATLFSLLLLCSYLSFGQSFNWNDKEFQPNTIRRLVIQYGLDSTNLRGEATNQTLDTLVTFLKKNPQLKVEIDNYSDPVTHKSSRILCQARAVCVVNKLIELGIDSARLVPKGWLKVISQQEYDAMKKKLGDKMYTRRTEIRILLTGRETFNWNDTDFYIGSKRQIRIQYGLDSAILRADSKRILDSAVGMLKANPHLKIQISGHTDPRSSMYHNGNLSQSRAQSCVDYLLSQGIDSVRLTAKGYWGTQPVPGCSIQEIAKMKTEKEKDEAYRKDRRTEIRILSTNYKREQ
jgi:outer membrane protein OmpA-like peptidoglycan-associated protein